MRRFIAILAAIAFFAPAITACSDDDGGTNQPEPTFTVRATATPNVGTEPLAVTFLAEISGGVQPFAYDWDFGDGSATSSDPAPTHQYDTAGAYPVTVTVTDADDRTASAHTYVVVTQDDSDVAVTVSASPLTGVAPLQVAFDCQVTGGNAPVTAGWEFGDGGASLSTQTVYTYSAPGTYQATCVAVDADGDLGAASLTVQVDEVTQPVNQPPTATATLVSAACVASPQTDLVEVDASASTDPENDLLTFSWSFVSVPVGSQVRFDNPDVALASFTPDLPGVYTMRVSVSDGHSTTVSSTLSVQVYDGSPSGLSVVSGNAQAGVAGSRLDEDLVVRVLDGCGDPVSNVTVRWSGRNALVAQRTSTTDYNGQASNAGHFGRFAGAGAVTAAVGCATATFDLTVQVGKATYLVLRPVTPAQTGQNATLTLEVTDVFLNPVTTQDASFTLELQSPGSPVFVSNQTPVLASQQTTGGTFTTQITDTVPGWAIVAITVHEAIGDPTLVLLPRSQWIAYSDDLEVAYGWDIPETSLWEQGAPTVGPSGAHSGTAVLGTDLDSLVPLGDRVDVASRELTLLSSPIMPIGGTIEFWQWYDLGLVCPAGCSTATGAVYVAGNRIEPVDGYGGPEVCGEPVAARGVGGASGGWQHLVFDYQDGHINGPVRNGVSFSTKLQLRFQSGAAGNPAAGWYVDDLVVKMIGEYMGAVQFLAVDPVSTTTTTRRFPVGLDVDECFAPWVTQTRALDTNGFPLMYGGVEVDFELDGAAFLIQVLAGEHVAGSGQAFTVATPPDGVIVLEIGDAVSEEVTITSSLAGVVGSESITGALFMEMSGGPGECCDSAVQVTGSFQPGPPPRYSGVAALGGDICSYWDHQEMQFCPQVGGQPEAVFVFTPPVTGLYYVYFEQPSAQCYGSNTYNVELHNVTNGCPGWPIAINGQYCFPFEIYCYSGFHQQLYLVENETYALVLERLGGPDCGDVQVHISMGGGC